MKTDEVLHMKALQLKQMNDHGTNADMLEQVIEQNPAVKEQLRNICAFISPQLFQEIDGLCMLLCLSKRQVVEMALQDFVVKARTVMDAVQPFGSSEASH